MATLTGSTFYCNGEETPDFRPTVTGRWNLIIDPQTLAQLTLNVFVNGRHDVAFGNNALTLISYDDGVYVFSAFGGFPTATTRYECNSGQVLLARRIRCQLPGSKPLQLADVLRSGEPGRRVRAG
jgi:hypothetical protein